MTGSRCVWPNDWPLYSLLEMRETGWVCHFRLHHQLHPVGIRKHPAAELVNLLRKVPDDREQLIRAFLYSKYFFRTCKLPRGYGYHDVCHYCKGTGMWFDWMQMVWRGCYCDSNRTTNPRYILRDQPPLPQKYERFIDEYYRRCRGVDGRLFTDDLDAPLFCSWPRSGGVPPVAYTPEGDPVRLEWPFSRRQTTANKEVNHAI